MKKLFFPLNVLIAIILSACNMTVLTGSGKIVSSNRPVSSFTRLVFDAPGDLTLTQNGKESLSIEGDDNLLEYIKSEVVNGELHIYVAPEAVMMEPSKTIRYSLNVKNLSQVTLNGSGKISAGIFKSDEFGLKLNGSGGIAFGSLNVKTLDFNLDGSGALGVQKLNAKSITLGTNGSGNTQISDIRAEALQVNLNGSGEYDLQGKITRQNAQILGSGKYDAHSLESAQAEISVNGSGHAQVWAADEINASILGSGSIAYVGSPKMTQKIAGSGSIYPLK